MSKEIILRGWNWNCIDFPTTYIICASKYIVSLRFPTKKKKKKTHLFITSTSLQNPHFYPILRERNRELWGRRRHGRWRRWVRSFGHGGFRSSEEAQLIFRWFIFLLIMSSSRLFLLWKPLFWSQHSVFSYSVVGVMSDFFFFFGYLYHFFIFLFFNHRWVMEIVNHRC